MRKYILLLISCLFVCGACQDDDTLNEVKGGLSIYLTDGVAETRSLPAALSDELKQQFQILLSRSRDGEMKVEYNDLLKDFGASRVFPVGTYKAAASFGANKNIALDEPYYYGEQHDIQIEKGKASTITIGCKVANALAAFTIVNPDNFNRVMKNYYVEIAVGGESVIWRPEDTTNPYFKAGSQVSFILKGTSVVTDEELSYALTPIEAVEAGMKYNYKLKLQPSNVGFDITTEAQKEPITINETVPEAWLPKAKLAAEGFDEQHILSYTETADAPEKAAITFTALRPVQDVEFTLNFADSHYTHLNKTYVLSTLSEEDRQALTDAGVVLPALDGTSTSGALDVRNMTPVLLTGDAGENVDNQIKVKVKANNRWSDEGTYTIRTVKPNFEMGVYPGTIWTKEFSVYLHAVTGNANKIKELSTFEWSKDGNTWEAIDKNALQCTSLEPNTTYWARTKYRYGDFVTQEFKTYPQIALENGGLEGYSIKRGQDGTSFLRGDYGAQFEWDSWSTLNVKTADKCTGTAFSYNSRSGSRPVSDIPSISTGKTAVWIMTIGYGYGGSDSSPKYVTPSEFSQDKSFISKPTSVCFLYKYIPYDNDKSDIYIKISHDNIVLGEGTFQETSSISTYKQYKLLIEYNDASNKLEPNKLSLMFKSGFNSSVESRESGGLTSAKTANPKFRGSELFIDDVELIYDK